MSKISAVIVDDEQSARDNLRYLILNYCPYIQIVAEAENVDNALIEIETHQPDVVFLDIEMPRKNGFQLLNTFETNVPFQVVFVTAYDKYAIKAFEVAALDYLLKPIDIDRLKEVAQKINGAIENSGHRLQLLKENTKVIRKIAVPYKSDYAILNITDIVCIGADRMYSIIHLKDGKKYITAKKLSYYENLLKGDNQFVRIHRSWLLNTTHNFTYSKKEKQVSVLQFIIPVSKGYKDHFEAIYIS